MHSLWDGLPMGIQRCVLQSRISRGRNSRERAVLPLRLRLSLRSMPTRSRYYPDSYYDWYGNHRQANTYEMPINRMLQALVEFAGILQEAIKGDLPTESGGLLLVAAS